MEKSNLKQEYNQHIAEDKRKIAELDKEISILKKSAQKNPKLDPYFRIHIISKILNQIDLKFLMNNESEKMLGIKNIAFLDMAKKSLSTIFAEIDTIVTLEIGEPIDFNRVHLDKILLFNARQKLNLHKHLKKCVDYLIVSYGDNTKWKWSFPDLRAKLAITGKNIFDFRELQRTRDPRLEFYYDLQEHIQIIKDDLFFAATEYANKYRISTKSPNDINYAISLLDDLKRICSVIGDDELLRKCKAGIDSYKASLEADQKMKDKK